MSIILCLTITGIATIIYLVFLNWHLNRLIEGMFDDEIIPNRKKEN